MKNSLLIFFGFFLFSLIPNTLLSQQWYSIGPEGASNLTSTHFDIENNTLLVGTTEGFWYYDLQSESWTSRVEEGSIGREVWSITGHPEYPGRIITGRKNGWFKGYMEISHDWGETNEPNFFSEGGYITDVKFCPTSPDILFACGWSDITPGDILKSTDGGESWIQLTNYLHTAMTEIALHPDNPDVLYVSGDAKVTKSTDGGQTWVDASNGLPPELGVYCISIDPFNPQTLLCSNDNGIYKSTDAGGTWEMIHNESCKRIEWHPVIEGVVVAITFEPYKLLLSYFSGTDFEDITLGYPGDQMMDIAFNDEGNALFVIALSGVHFINVVPSSVDETKLDNNKLKSLSIYPNPTKGVIHFSDDLDNYDYEIFSAAGQLFEKGKIKQNLIDLSAFDPGLYFIRVADSTRNYFYKFLKQ